MLRTWTYLLVIALVLAPLLAITEVTDPLAEELVTLIAGGVLVPVWAIWLARSVESAPDPAAA